MSPETLDRPKIPENANRPEVPVGAWRETAKFRGKMALLRPISGRLALGTYFLGELGGFCFWGRGPELGSV